MRSRVAEQAARDRYQARMAAVGNCRCGRSMDRDGRLCAVCNDANNRRCRQRYRRSDYGAAWTRSMVARSSALERRGVL